MYTLISSDKILKNYSLLIVNIVLFWRNFCSVAQQVLFLVKMNDQLFSLVSSNII